MAEFRHKNTPNNPRNYHYLFDFFFRCLNSRQAFPLDLHNESINEKNKTTEKKKQLLEITQVERYVNQALELGG